MFDSITFWCEFPSKTNWKTINKINFKTSIYVAVESKKEFLKYKSKVQNKKIKLGAWPIIPKEEGYWFSSYSSKNSIDKLSRFKGIPIKIDLEPPIFKGNVNFKNYMTYFIKYFSLWSGKNDQYLKDRVVPLKNQVILSTFPFPDFFLRKIGASFPNNFKKNFFVYTSLLPFSVRPLSRIYYKWFIRNQLKKDTKTMIAVGCTGPGIFGNERPYPTINELKKDIELVNKLGVKNLVVFELSNLSNRADSKTWFNLISTYLR